MSTTTLHYIEFISFVVDCSEAGDGKLTVDVNGVNTRPLTRMMDPVGSLFKIGFLPQENKPQTIVVTFNKEPVPGNRRQS